MVSKDLMRQRIAFIRQGSEVERFHTKRMIQRNDVGHHSFHVAMLSDLIATAEGLSAGVKYDIMRAALAHDLAEHIVGDMPGDAKRELGIREQFARYEQTRFDEVGMDYECMLTPQAKRIIKLCDMLEGGFYCVSEASLGNARIGLVFRNFWGYIQKFAPFSEAEQIIVDYLMELWLHYGVNDAPAWGRTAHDEASLKDNSIMGQDEDERSESITYPGKASGLLDALRAEEAEGRETKIGTCNHKRATYDMGADRWSCADCGALNDHGRQTGAWYDPQSNTRNAGDAGVPSGPVDDTSDDRASQDLTTGPLHAPANARQHGGDHYKGVGYEHWDLVLDVGMNYFQGCATKYVTRCRKHEAGCRLNILKAIHYVDKLTEALKDGRIKWGGEPLHTYDNIATFQASNQLNPLETQIIADIVSMRLGQARQGLEQILETCPQSE